MKPAANGRMSSSQQSRRTIGYVVAGAILVGATAGSLAAVDANGKVQTMYVSSEVQRVESSTEVMGLRDMNIPLADWVPQLEGITLYPAAAERQIPEQENMFSQLMLADADILSVEAAMREWMKQNGFNVSPSAVNEWGNDADWDRGIQFAGMVEGVEMSVTLSAKAPNRGVWGEPYKSAVLIWRSARDNITAQQAAEYRGYGDGFIPLDQAR